MKTLIRCFLFIILTVSCTSREKHFLTDKTYRDLVHEQFLNRKELLKNRDTAMLSVFNDTPLTVEQREALEFLYAYMPLCDLADYDGRFFLDQVSGGQVQIV
jgi:hypothetical protein